MLFSLIFPTFMTNGGTADALSVQYNCQKFAVQPVPDSGDTFLY